jgi:hypothetical protein
MRHLLDFHAIAVVQEHCQFDILGEVVRFWGWISHLEQNAFLDQQRLANWSLPSMHLWNRQDNLFFNSMLHYYQTA